MPIDNNDLLFAERDLPEVPSTGYDVVAQAREATASPSPLIRILQDPSLMPRRSKDNLKKDGKRPSRSPHRPHRSPMVVAIALAEEERQANHLKSLLRHSTDRLEYEIKRADEATARADYSERREREAVARALAAEAAQEEARKESIRLEKDSRHYQVTLECAQRDGRRLEADIHDVRREIEELQELKARAEDMVHQYQQALKDVQTQIERRGAEVQDEMANCFDDGHEDGYEEGYTDGYEDGRRGGVKEGVKKGRKEGLLEGREQGRREERQNALEAFDEFLAEEMNEDERTRRWAQSIYNVAPTEEGYEFESSSQR